MTGAERKKITDDFNALDIEDRRAFLEYLIGQSTDEYKTFVDNIRKQAVEDFWFNERKAILDGTSTYNWTSEQDVCKIISEISVDAGVNNNAPTVLYSGSICNYSTNKIVTSMNIIKIRINIVFLLLKPIGKLF